MNAFGIQKYLLFLCVIVSTASLSAADTVVVPESFDDLSEYFVQLSKALDQAPSINMVDAYECLAFIILSGNARLLLKDRAWPAPQCVRDDSGYFMQVGERRRRECCGLPDLKKTFDTIIATVKSGWKKDLNPLEGWNSFIKEESIEKEEAFIKSIANMFALNDVVKCRSSGVLYFEARQDKMEEVQGKLGFQLPEE